MFSSSSPWPVTATPPLPPHLLPRFICRAYEGSQLLIYSHSGEYLGNEPETHPGVRVMSPHRKKISILLLMCQTWVKSTVIPRVHLARGWGGFGFGGSPTPFLPSFPPFDKYSFVILCEQDLQEGDNRNREGDGRPAGCPPSSLLRAASCCQQISGFAQSGAVTFPQKKNQGCYKPTRVTHSRCR